MAFRKAVSNISAQWEWYKTNTIGGDTENNAGIGPTVQWETVDNTSPFYVSKIYVAQITVPAVGSASLVLGHGLLDFSGATFGFATIKDLLIQLTNAIPSDSVAIVGTGVLQAAIGQVNVAYQYHTFRLTVPLATGIFGTLGTNDSIIFNDGNGPIAPIFNVFVLGT